MIRLLLTLLLFTNAAALAQAPPPASAKSQPVVSAVDSIGITVSDIDRAVDFYSRVLTFEKVSEAEVAGDEYEHLYGVFGLRLRVVRMRLGEESVELMQFLAPRGRPEPPDSRSNDHWFQHVAIIVSDMDRAYARLRENKVAHASSGPQLLPAWNKGAGGISAFYFRDPDGNTLEILSFPPDKGDRRWQAKDRLFLGIDHTAIVVADTDRSLAYYRDTLGLTVAGGAENYGTEQEHLNNVFGARLRITALRAAGGGPGVELLEYLAPRTGRPMPVDTLASDEWHWQVNMDVFDASAGAAAVRRAHYAEVSNGVIRIDGAALAFDAGFMVRDPDGHASLLTER
ncbi:MAG: glyoxalase [Gammaproteobacteria bacterium]|nr:glyoxalase [Gammaproteobacteria bacterium]